MTETHPAPEPDVVPVGALVRVGIGLTILAALITAGALWVYRSSADELMRERSVAAEARP